MRVPVRQRRYGLRFNITPLIDVVFLLIIFFLTSSHFVRSETQEAVDLPEASETEDEAAAELKRLVVTITADRALHVGGAEVTLVDLEERIGRGARDFGEEFEVRIRGDKSVPYETIEPIMLACARAGVTRVKFPVIEK